MGEQQIDPRVAAYAVDGFRVEKWFDNGRRFAPTHFSASNGSYHLSADGSPSRVPHRTRIFEDALVRLLRYADRVLPEGQMRVVPDSLDWDEPLGWICRDLPSSSPDRNLYLNNDGTLRVFGDGWYGAAWNTPSAALLALIEHEARQLDGPPPETPPQRWCIAATRGGYGVVDGSGNGLELGGDIISESNLEPRPRYTAQAIAYYANAHGPHPPQPEVWKMERETGLGGAWMVSRRGTWIAKFRGEDAEQHARAWMERKQGKQGGRGDE